MKAIEIKKLERVENQDTEMLQMGIVAFQMVEFSFPFFGADINSVLDTKIMSDGRQEVIDGDGFIPAGTQI